MSFMELQMLEIETMLNHADLVNNWLNIIKITAYPPSSIRTGRKLLVSWIL